MCWKCILKSRSFCPVELWPKYMVDMIIKSSHLNRSKRIKSVCFLYGNAFTDKKKILCLLSDKLKDNSAIVHVNSIIKDLEKGTYDSQWTYYNINEKCLLYMNNQICMVQAKISSIDLKINIWNRFASKYKTDLNMQNKFFGEDREFCDKIYALIVKE